MGQCFGFAVGLFPARDFITAELNWNLGLFQWILQIFRGIVPTPDRHRLANTANPMNPSGFEPRI